MLVMIILLMVMVTTTTGAMQQIPPLQDRVCSSSSRYLHPLVYDDSDNSENVSSGDRLMLKVRPMLMMIIVCIMMPTITTGTVQQILPIQNRVCSSNNRYFHPLVYTVMQLIQKI